MVTLLNSVQPDFQNSDLSSPSCFSYLKKTFPFESEDSLVNEFKNITKTKNIKPRSRKKFGLVTELESGNGIADIVVFKLRSNWKEYSGISTLNPRWTSILISLPYRKVFTINDFIKIACCSNQTAEKILKAFEQSNFIIKAKHGWLKIKQPRPPINTIYAIEAKIKDWKRALYQASRYKEFANQSWVLLDNHYCRPALDNLGEFKKRNIGLLTIDAESNINVIVESLTQMPNVDYRYWYVCTNILNSILSK